MHLINAKNQSRSFHACPSLTRLETQTESAGWRRGTTAMSRTILCGYKYHDTMHQPAAEAESVLEPAPQTGATSVDAYQKLSKHSF